MARRKKKNTSNQNKNVNEIVENVADEIQEEIVQNEDAIEVETAEEPEEVTEEVEAVEEPEEEAEEVEAAEEPEEVTEEVEAAEEPEEEAEEVEAAEEPEEEAEEVEAAEELEEETEEVEAAEEPEEETEEVEAAEEPEEETEEVEAAEEPEEETEEVEAAEEPEEETEEVEAAEEPEEETEEESDDDDDDEAEEEAEEESDDDDDAKADEDSEEDSDDDDDDEADEEAEDDSGASSGDGDFDMSQFMDENGEIDYAAMMQARMASGGGATSGASGDAGSSGGKGKKPSAIKKVASTVVEAVGGVVENVVDAAKESTGIKSFFGTIHKALLGNLKLGVRFTLAFGLIIVMTVIGQLIYIVRLNSICDKLESADSQNYAKIIEQCDEIVEKGTHQAKIILIFGIIITLIIAVILAIDIISNIKKIVRYAGALNDGDLTYSIKADTYDEFGLLARSLNNATLNFRSLMETIVVASEDLSNVVSSCKSDCDDMTNYLDDTADAAAELTRSMEGTTANANSMQMASSEIKSAAEVVALKAEDGVTLAMGISDKASALSNQFNKAHDESIEMFDGIKGELEETINQAKTVNEIKNLADTILEITAQTNLIALNAAIEAARAGDAGRGFAVVSDEIRNLADKSKKAASDIKAVTDTVISSVQLLIKQTNKLLSFMEENVLDDYKVMLQATNDYDTDSVSVNDMTSELSAISEELAATVDNMVETIVTVARMSEDGTATTEVVEGKVIDIANRAKGILEGIDVVAETSNNLLEEVRKFKLKEQGAEESEDDDDDEEDEED